MAKTVIVKTICDRCNAEGKEGVEGAEEVRFAYDSYSYALDLCAPHAEDFHNTVQAMISWSPEREPLKPSRGSRAPSESGSAAKPQRPPARRDKEQIAAIREWANANGFKVSNRGRIPGEVEAAFEAAH